MQNKNGYLKNAASGTKIDKSLANPGNRNMQKARVVIPITIITSLRKIVGIRCFIKSRIIQLS